MVYAFVLTSFLIDRMAHIICLTIAFLGLGGKFAPPPTKNFCYQPCCHSYLGFLYLQGVNSNTLVIRFFWIFSYVHYGQLEGQFALSAHAVLMVSL